jgi:iron(III) transport system permease protein
LLAAWLLIFVAGVRELGASILLMGPDSKVMTPAIVEAWFSSSSELTAAMALIQTAVITATIVVFSLFTRRLAHHGTTTQ